MNDNGYGNDKINERNLSTKGKNDDIDEDDGVTTSTTMDAASEQMDARAELEAALTFARPFILEGGRTLGHRLRTFFLPPSISPYEKNLYFVKATPTYLELEIWGDLENFRLLFIFVLAMSIPITTLFISSDWMPPTRELITAAVQGAIFEARFQSILSAWFHATISTVLVMVIFILLPLLGERLTSKPIILIIDGHARIIGCNAINRRTRWLRGVRGLQWCALDALQRAEFCQPNKFQRFEIDGVLRFTFHEGGGCPQRTWTFPYKVNKEAHVAFRQLVGAFLHYHHPSVTVVPSPREVRLRRVPEKRRHAEVDAEKTVRQQLRTAKQSPTPVLRDLARADHRACLRDLPWRGATLLGITVPSMTLIGVLVVVTVIMYLLVTATVAASRNLALFQHEGTPDAVLQVVVLLLAIQGVAMLCSWGAHRWFPVDPYFPTSARLVVAFLFDHESLRRRWARLSKLRRHELAAFLSTSRNGRFESPHDGSDGEVRNDRRTPPVNDGDDNAGDGDDDEALFEKTARHLVATRQYLAAQLASAHVEDRLRFIVSLTLLLAAHLMLFMGDLFVLLRWRELIQASVIWPLMRTSPGLAGLLSVVVLGLTVFLMVAMLLGHWGLYQLSFVFHVFSFEDEDGLRRFQVPRLGTVYLSFALGLILATVAWGFGSDLFALGLAGHFLEAFVLVLVGGVLLVMGLFAGLGIAVVGELILRWAASKGWSLGPQGKDVMLIRALSLTRALRERVAAALAQRESSDARGAAEATSPEGGGDDEKTSLKILLDTLMEVERWATMDDAEFLAALREVEARRREAIAAVLS